MACSGSQSLSVVFQEVLTAVQAPGAMLELWMLSAMFRPPRHSAGSQAALQTCPWQLLQTVLAMFICTASERQFRHPYATGAPAKTSAALPSSMWWHWILLIPFLAFMSAMIMFLWLQLHAFMLSRFPRMPRRGLTGGVFQQFVKAADCVEDELTSELLLTHLLK